MKVKGYTKRVKGKRRIVKSYSRTAPIASSASGVTLNTRLARGVEIRDKQKKIRAARERALSYRRT